MMNRFKGAVSDFWEVLIFGIPKTNWHLPKRTPLLIAPPPNSQRSSCSGFSRITYCTFNFGFLFKYEHEPIHLHRPHLIWLMQRLKCMCLMTWEYDTFCVQKFCCIDFVDGHKWLFCRWMEVLWFWNKTWMFVLVKYGFFFYYWSYD